MNNKNILIVGGTWDNNGGKESSIVRKIAQNTEYTTLYNGGYYSKLENIIESSIEYNLIYWFANVPNNLPKLKTCKSVNPYALVVGSKRNLYNENEDKMEYSFVQILNKTLLQRNNLSIEFSKEKDSSNYKFMLFDPLGTSWYNGYDIKELCNKLNERIDFILSTRRENTYQIDGNIGVINDREFFEYVRETANIFHKTIMHDNGVTRYLGNASFRGNNNIIYVTKRDVDKSKIDIHNFVPSFLDIDNKVKYYGNFKPSKDTVVQTRLYKMFKTINYIVHSHCYAENGYFTSTPVPCGALDEIDEVIKVIDKYYNSNYDLNYYKINLLGHGCLILGNSLSDMKKTNYYTRILPETIKKSL